MIEQLFSLNKIIPVVIINDVDKVSFIDYQSAMKGPLMYDVISFLFQAKANFTEQFKTEMLEFYIDLFEDIIMKVSK